MPPALDNPYAGSLGDFGPLEGAQRAQQAAGSLPSPFDLAGGPAKASELEAVHPFQPITAAERQKCEGAFHAKVGACLCSQPDAKLVCELVKELAKGLCVLMLAVVKECDSPWGCWAIAARRCVLSDDACCSSSAHSLHPGCRRLRPACQHCWIQHCSAYC